MSISIDIEYAKRLSPKLELFEAKGPRLFVFRCPICGDSKKNKHKRRGFIYESKSALAMKCHNCHAGMWLGDFIQSLDMGLAQQYRVEKFKDRRGTLTEKRAAEASLNKAPDIQPEDWNPPKLSSLSPSNPARAYAEKRRIPHAYFDDLFYVRDPSELEKWLPAYKDRLPRDERLAIPFRDRSGTLQGVTMRSLNPDDKLRYASVRFVQGVPLAWGLNLVDPGRRVRVFEGAFDAMVVDNSVGAGGSDFNRVMSLFPGAVAVFDNQPRNPQIVHAYNKAVDKGWTLFVPPGDWRWKDFSERAAETGETPGELAEFVNTNAYSGLRLRQAIATWKRC